MDKFVAPTIHVERMIKISEKDLKSEQDEKPFFKITYNNIQQQQCTTTTTTYIKKSFENHVKKKNTFMYEARANDEEEERKYVLGFYCDRYDNTIKKRELIDLYYI